jgi:hypothetical protein
MNYRALRVLIFSVLIICLLVISYLHFVPQKTFTETRSLGEPEILSGDNGKVFSYSYNGVGYLGVDYSFNGDNYTTGYLKKGFIYPSSIEEDGLAPRVVDQYFNDSRFLSFQFYFDKNINDIGDYHLGFIKGVGNENEFHYNLDLQKEIYYGKFGYGASCQLLPDKNEASITYYPDGRDGTFLGVIIVIILAILYLAIDYRLFP